MNRLTKYLEKVLTVTLIPISLSYGYGKFSYMDDISGNKDIQKSFTGIRLINGHSVETQKSGELVFLITHRFGRINTGMYEFFGLDDANIRLGFDYAFTDRFMIGIGRNSFEKVYDGFLKFNVVRPSNTFPFYITLFGSAAITTLKSPDPSVEITFNQRLDYSSQLLIASTIGKHLSLQFMPSLVHRNYVETDQEENSIFAFGLGGSYKIGKKFAITTEYFPRLNGTEAEGYYNSFSLGLDVQTGGHVFQLMLTNSRPMIEKGFIAETTGQWSQGDIHFGFNISRTFNLRKYDYSKDW